MTDLFNWESPEDIVKKVLKQTFPINYDENDVRFRYEGKLEAPDYKTEGASGFDLFINDPKWDGDGILIWPNATVIVETGVWIDHCHPLLEVQLRSRSSLALNHGIVVKNAPATIDSDYRGQLKLIIYNMNLGEPFALKYGERIAQAVVCPIWKPKNNKVPYSIEGSPQTSTKRGSGGFGSTGRKS